MKVIKTIGKIIVNIIAFIVIATVGLAVYSFATAVIETGQSLESTTPTKSAPAVSDPRKLEIERVMNKYGYAIVVVKASHKGQIRCTAYDSNKNVLGTISTFVVDSVEEITWNIHSDNLATAGCGYR